MSTTRTYKVQNMKCGGCVAAATSVVEKLPGVESAEIDLDSASGTITGDIAPEQIIAALTEAGYPASLSE